MELGGHWSPWAVGSAHQQPPAFTTCSYRNITFHVSYDHENKKEKLKSVVPIVTFFFFI